MTTFIAYPSSNREIVETITKAAEKTSPRAFRTWQQEEIPGAFLSPNILESIRESRSLIADVTHLNFNVMFEMGFAIGLNKPVTPTIYLPLRASRHDFDQLGIIDTLTYKEYANSDDLLEIFKQDHKAQALKTGATPLNHSSPVYVLEPKTKTDAAIRITARLKKARLFYRSFDPAEFPRLSAWDAITHVQQSYGVLLHLLPSTYADATIHNLRAAFLAGLATGMAKVLLILQQGDRDPVPLDYRDLVRVFLHPDKIDDAIADFAAEVTGELQRRRTKEASKPHHFLDSLTLGSTAAENELRELSTYYLETDQYRRTSRGEIRIVVGRKGSGKSALFFHLRNSKRRRINNLVLDLKPEGFQLLKFKETVLSTLQEGTLEHTVTAFWEYVLLLELSHKIVEQDKGLLLRRQELQGPYQSLRDNYYAGDYTPEGDFAERISHLLDFVRDNYLAKFGQSTSQRLGHPQLTQILYNHNVRELRNALEEYLDHKDEVWILFDNLDKGWPPRGLQKEDLLLLRCLIDAGRNLERQLQKRQIECHTVIFLRNDVYEHLIRETVDRGKEAKVLLDWTDPDLLRELVRRRIIANDDSLRTLEFDDLWRRICVSHLHGEESFQYLTDRSLMRPRYLLSLIGHCRSVAVNLGHRSISASDIEKGLRAYSSDVISDIGAEIRDVEPDAEDILYVLIGEPPEIQQDRFEAIIADSGLQMSADSALEALIWYGVLGISTGNGEGIYIHHKNYDIKLLSGILKKQEDSKFLINPAFWSALGITG